MKMERLSRIGHEEGCFTVEVATIDHDLMKIATVVNTAYKKVKYLQDGIERISHEEIANSILSPHKRVYLCISPTHEICGTILLNFCDKDQAEIGLFAIDPNYQGQKISPMFMAYVEREAFEQVRIIILKVIPLFQENLVKFYMTLGYQMTGQTLAFPEEDKLRYIRPECRDRVAFSIMQKDKLQSYA
jgi:N-acetylglutamate synthase-like GNAT family acetyltransferase